MRTTLTLDADVYAAAVHLARASGRRLGAVVSELARRGLKPAESPRARGRKRFATFTVSPDAPIIPASRVQKYLDEEGGF